ncbi:MAG: hypothetical protein KQH63_06035 [Desulfobulbaceae bacterium]|nr:hypothetical protein [Desulfobulbaceae bacterium]
MKSLKRITTLTGRKSAFPGILGIVLAVSTLSGCSDNQMGNFNRFLANKELTEPVGPIFQKQYTTASLPRAQLDNLLDMALYTGPPETYGDVIFRERSAQHRVDPVVFSHQSHRKEFTCRVCHIELEFSMKRGETGITREDYLDGLYCGACHNGDIAFSVKYSCNLCHVKIDEGEKGRNTTRSSSVGGGMPAQDYGDGINWVEAMENGVIAPRDTIYSEEAPESMPLPEHLKDPLRWTTRSPRTTVYFPHVTHIKWLDCANCHPDIFTIEKMGTMEFDKEKNLYGMFCGTCHMTVAFPMNGCSRCHPGQRDRS